MLELKKGDNQKLIFLNFLKSLFASIIINADYRYIEPNLGFEEATSEVNKIDFDINHDYSETPFSQLQFEHFLEIFLEKQTYFNKKSIFDIVTFLKVSSSLTGNSDDTFTISKKDLDLIELITKYEYLLKNYTNEPGTSMKIGFLDFYWKGMSSGEIAFLNLFARLHEVHKKLEDTCNYPTNIYLLIDEGEQGFHFQWQKEYLKILTEIIPEIFNDGTKIHLIFATHSPITLSDMPNNHIVFLKKYVNNEVRVLTDNSVKNTFAANIHEILYDGFL